MDSERLWLFDDLPLLDKAAVSFTHLVYSAGLHPEFTSFGVLISLAAVLVYLGAYSTVVQPKCAIDANEDKASPLWDQSDRDGCPLLLGSPLDLKTPNETTIDFKKAAIMPLFASGALYGMYKLMTMYESWLAIVLNYIILSQVLLMGIPAYGYFLRATGRNIGYRLGCKGNSAFFLKRHRWTYSEETELPLGILEQFEPSEMKMTKKELQEVEEFMWEKNRASLLRLPKLRTSNQKMAIVFDDGFVYGFVISLALTALYYFHNPQLYKEYEMPNINWVSNNVVAITLALGGLHLMRVGKFKVAATLLLGLFAYDIYFVFKTTIMVSVATGIDIPAKIVFPHAPTTLYHYREGVPLAYKQMFPRNSLLGLGDIVVPGVFASLCLRFDYHIFYSRNRVAFHRLRSIGVPKYFTVAMASYVSSLVLTVSVCYVYDHGQPALLYIVPAMLLSTSLTALLSGQLRQLWEYSEELEVYDPKKDTIKVTEHNSALNSVLDAEDKTASVLGDGPIYEFSEVGEESDDTYIFNESTDSDEADSEQDDDLGDIETERHNLIIDLLKSAES